MAEVTDADRDKAHRAVSYAADIAVPDSPAFWVALADALARIFAEARQEADGLRQRPLWQSKPTGAETAAHAKAHPVRGMQNCGLWLVSDPLLSHCPAIVLLTVRDGTVAVETLTDRRPFPLSDWTGEYRWTPAAEDGVPVRLQPTAEATALRQRCAGLEAERDEDRHRTKAALQWVTELEAVATTVHGKAVSGWNAVWALAATHNDRSAQCGAEEVLAELGTLSSGRAEFDAALSRARMEAREAALREALAEIATERARPQPHDFDLTGLAVSERIVRTLQGPQPDPRAASVGGGGA